MRWQSFFIGGGMNPTSVLAGFDTNTLTAAFNVSYLDRQFTIWFDVLIKSLTLPR